MTYITDDRTDVHKTATEPRPLVRSAKKTGTRLILTRVYRPVPGHSSWEVTLGLLYAVYTVAHFHVRWWKIFYSAKQQFTLNYFRPVTQT